MAPPRRRKANISRPSGGPPGSAPTSRAAQTRANISRARTSRADIARDLDAARGRKEFFPSRPDVSDDRAARRMTQADELQRFKNLYTKPVYTDTGSRVTGVTQMKLDAPRTLEQERQRLVQQYGPTTREVMGDIGFGLGSLAQGVGQAAQQYIGSGGLFGLAVNAFKGLSNTVDQKRQQLGEKISALTDVQKEKIANPSNHKLSILKDPELQDIALTEREQMTAKQQADLIKQGITQLDTMVPSTLYGLPQQPPGFKVMPEGQRELLEEIKTSNIRNTNQNNVANLTESGQMIYDRMQNLNMSPERINERMQQINESNLSRGVVGPLFAAEGGSVDSRLAEMQKSTNNIYGTGILSVR